MQHLLRKKIVLCTLFLVAGFRGMSQEFELNRLDHDEKPYYFSIIFPISQNRFLMSHDPRFLQYDSVMAVQPQNTFGWGLGLKFTYRLSDRFELRTNVFELLFVDKTINYTLKYPGLDEKPITVKKIESTLLRFPLQVKFNSDRIGNFRVYMMGGVRFDYDLASNARAKRAEDLVKIAKSDFGVEGGLGFKFYFPMFTLSPEIKFSHGTANIHSRDPNLKFSNVINQLYSRQFVFSIILE
jgi:Outer membrane protein beta-barrel domain